ILHDAGFPAGVFNLVLGGGGTVGDEIVQNSDVHAISFTGSNEVGGDLYQQASRRGIRVQCEMGGKNPMIVLSDANLSLAVSGASQGGFGSTGQRCTATSRVIVESTIAEKFIQMLMDAMDKIKVGNGMDPGIDMGPLVDESQMDTVLKYIEIGKSEQA